MYTLLFKLIDFFEHNISSKCFLFTNLTITRLLAVVLLCPRGKWWQPSISTGFIMLESQQHDFQDHCQVFCSKFLIFQHCFFYYTALACNFSRLIIQFSRLTLTSLTITSSLVIFSFPPVTRLRLWALRL